MAKRKRKMTLFDVMHSGQSVGLQVRTRVPSYQPTPELPVTKKLAKLFGRAPRKAEANHPRSAADELAQLRRELASKTSAVEAAETSPPAESPTTTSFRTAEPIAEVFSSPSAEPEAAREPAMPRRSLGEILSEQWVRISPKLETLKSRLRTVGHGAARNGVYGISAVRELFNRYAVTAAAAIGVVVLLCGSFYAGKLLFNRPGAGIQNQIATNDTRPDVLDLSDPNATHANEAIANIDSRQPETTLQRQADPQKPAKPAVFGGRRLDANYVIIQSYPTQVEALATVDVLAKYGVKSTVELNLPKWSSAGSTLYSVVGVDPYQKLSGNSEYDAFKAKIAKISDAEKGQTIAKALAPSPYRWTSATP